MNELTQQGITALKAGDRAAARRILAAAVRQSPDDSQAWLWLSGAVERDQERLDCLRQVLRIEPGNTRAAQGIELLQQRQSTGVEKAAHEADQTLPAAFELPQAPVEVEQTPEPSLILAEQPLAEELVGKGVQTQEVEEFSIPSAAHPAPSSTASPFGTGERIFRLRPSIAPALVLFWVLIFGIWLMNSLIHESYAFTLTLTLLICGVLAILLGYVIVKQLTTRYELTSQTLSLPYHGKPAQVPTHLIFQADCAQGALQKVFGIGDICIEAGINGRLTRVRLRNLPKYQQHAQQLAALIDSRQGLTA